VGPGVPHPAYPLQLRWTGPKCRFGRSLSITMMNAVAETLVVAFGLFLLGLTAVVFTKPSMARRFFMAFASSARAHYTEQAVRLLIGAALVVLSPTMWRSTVFWFLGWAIVLSSLALLLSPWRWHHRFGERVKPILIPRMRLFALGLAAFGVLLLYGVFAESS